MIALDQVGILSHEDLDAELRELYNWTGRVALARSDAEVGAFYRHLYQHRLVHATTLCIARVRAWEKKNGRQELPFQVLFAQCAVASKIRQAERSAGASG